MNKQIVRVLEAVECGAKTSLECSLFTDLSVKTCSSYLSELSKAGVIQVVDTVHYYAVNGKRGHASNVYELSVQTQGKEMVESVTVGNSVTEVDMLSGV